MIKLCAVAKRMYLVAAGAIDPELAARILRLVFYAGEEAGLRDGDALPPPPPCRAMILSATTGRGARQRRGLAMVRVIMGLGLAANQGLAQVPAAQRARLAVRPSERATETALVFDGVTVVDVTTGKLVPAQRVVVTGNRIQAVGPAAAVPKPAGAQVVEARGKYLIPGLWDMDVHSRQVAHFFYPLLLANGVTGIRDAGSELPLGRLVAWRRAILAGRRIGSPRQILAGPLVSSSSPCPGRPSVCSSDTAQAHRLIDSLRTAGVDMITISLPLTAVDAMIAATRRAGLPLGLAGGNGRGAWTAMEAADTGIAIFDHLRTLKDFDARCVIPDGNVAQCQPVAERFQQHRTWWIPALLREFYAKAKWIPAWRRPGPAAAAILDRFSGITARFWTGTVPRENWLSDAGHLTEADSLEVLALAQEVGLPLLAGTDTDIGASDDMWKLSPGFALHAELALDVSQGLTPLAALQSATLNPAKFLGATDSLGTIASGKLADLVLLDANPLADITNTTTIRAVVANGRYFDRATLDRLLAETQRTTRDAP